MIVTTVEETRLQQPTRAQTVARAAIDILQVLPEVQTLPTQIQEEAVHMIVQDLTRPRILLLLEDQRLRHEQRLQDQNILLHLLRRIKERALVLHIQEAVEQITLAIRHQKAVPRLDHPQADRAVLLLLLLAKVRHRQADQVENIKSPFYKKGRDREIPAFCF